MSPRLAFALEAAHTAGRQTLAHFQTDTSVELKYDRTPVTIADRSAERLIREMIEKEYPGDDILGEEEGGDDSSTNRWIIDPIDGTKSFISGVPLYATLVSYEQDRRPVVAACYFPALDEMIYAEIGAGTYMNGRKCQVKPASEIRGTVLCCGGHKTMLSQNRMNGFLKMAETALATRTWSDAYGHALVASGRVDAMIDATVSRWDISSMSLIVREAGGAFVDFNGFDSLDHPRADGLYESISTSHELLPAILAAFQ